MNKELEKFIDSAKKIKMTNRERLVLCSKIASLVMGGPAGAPPARAGGRPMLFSKLSPYFSFSFINIKKGAVLIMVAFILFIAPSAKIYWQEYQIKQDLNELETLIEKDIKALDADLLEIDKLII